MNRIELDTVWKARNGQEGRRVNRARFRDLEEIGDGAIICRLMRRALAIWPDLGGVSVWRGGECCFAEMPAETWASAGVAEGHRGSPRFVRHKEWSGVDA